MEEICCAVSLRTAANAILEMRNARMCYVFDSEGVVFNPECMDESTSALSMKFTFHLVRHLSNVVALISMDDVALSP